MRDARVEKMHTYWQGVSGSYSGALAPQVEKMKEMIKGFVPEDVRDVLDIGTGGGIMACTLASLGKDVTAVDLCEGMIESAGKNADSLGLKVNFRQSEADSLPFEDDTFDMIVNRWLLWALPDPDKALREWHRVLKPGGVLLYIDGNHYKYLFSEPDKTDRERIIEINGSAHGKNDTKKDDYYKLCDDTALDLPLSRLNRPFEWDDKALPKAGFEIIDENIHYPQRLLDFGIGEGYYTNFLIFAKSRKG